MKETESRSENPADPFGYEWIESPSHPGNYFYRNPFARPAARAFLRILDDGLFAYEAKSAFHYRDELVAIAGKRRVSADLFPDELHPAG